MRLWFTILCILLLLRTSGQQNQNVLEGVDVHLSSDQVIAGETLFFSATVRSKANGQLSALSRILYVELLDEQGRPVEQQKLVLEQGYGQGDIFISSLYSTGIYHLTAYTRWMKNFQAYSHQPLLIVNPFEVPEARGEPTKKISLRFFPEGGNIVAGITNRIAILSEGIQGPVNGRIVDDTGSTTEKFTIDRTGAGTLEFIPEDKMYQAVIEDSKGQFLFFDLPNVCTSCTQLSVRELSDHFSIRLRGNDINGRLLIKDRQGTYYDQQLNSARSFTVERTALPAKKLAVIYESATIANRQVRMIENSVSTDMEIASMGLYGSRESVEFDVALDEPALLTMSIKHYKLDALQGHSSHPIADSLPKDWLVPLDSFRYYPETRGDIVGGHVVPVLADQLAVVSFPGERFQFQVDKTDDNGHFEVTLNPFYEDREAFAKTLGFEGEIEMENEFYNAYNDLPDYRFDLDSVMIRQIMASSLNVQVENAYYTLRSDTLKVPPGFGDQLEQITRYRLDDYTRFPSLRDTFIEYVPEVGVRKNESNFRLNIRILNRGKQRYPSLLLIDGLMVDAEQILMTSPYAIGAINVLNNRFYFGDAILDGILSLESVEGDFGGVEPRAQPWKLTGLQIPKEYYQVKAPVETTMPDRRELLAWQPNVLTQGQHTFQFVTSDIKGEFEVRVEGITLSGKRVSATTMIVVE